jgi:hypothetical protein
MSGRSFCPFIFAFSYFWIWSLAGHGLVTLVTLVTLFILRVYPAKLKQARSGHSGHFGHGFTTFEYLRSPRKSDMSRPSKLDQAVKVQVQKQLICKSHQTDNIMFHMENRRK